MTEVGSGGLYIAWNGVEYPLQGDINGKWMLIAGLVERPGPEWQEKSRGWWYLPITAEDVDEVIRITYRGVYRGVPVEATPVDDARVLLTSGRVREGVRVGMEQKDGYTVEAIVPRDDPDLTVTVEREITTFPR